MAINVTYMLNSKFIIEIIGKNVILSLSDKYVNDRK